MAGKLQLASSGGDIKIWGTPDLTLVKAFIPHSQPVGSLCWSPNNQCLASAASDKVVVTYVKGDVYSPIEILAGEGNTCVAFNSSSRYLLTGGKSKTLGIWDMKTKGLKKTYRDHKDVVSCLAFNWNDTVIASGSVNGDILLHNALTGQASDPLRLQKTQAVRDIQFSYFKKSLLGAVSDDGALNLWDSNTRKLLTSFNADHKAPATGLSFSPMNDMLVCSVGLDKRIVFYDVQGKKSVKVMTAESPLTAVDFMADGATLAVGSTRGKIFVYDLRCGSAPVGTTAAHKTSVQALSFQSSVKVSSTGSNRSGKPATLNAKPFSGHPPVQLAVTTAPNQPSTPTSKPPEPTAEVLNYKENGLKEDDEDIFSPLREIKTPVINSRLAALPGSEEQTSTSFKANNQPDVSGIFSPLGSNPSVLNDVHLGGSTLQTLGETTANVPTTSQNSRSFSNVKLSSTRPISDLPPAQDLRSASGLKSYSDSHLINDQRPADTRPPSDSLQGGSLVSNRARPQFGLVVDSRPPLDERARKTNNVSGTYSAKNSRGSWDGLDTVVQGSNQQPLLKSDPGAVRTGNKDGKDEVRRPADGAGTVEQGPGQCGTALSDSNMLGDGKLSQEPLTSGAVTMLLPSTNREAGGNPGLLPFQVQFIKNLIDESLDEFRVALHRDIVNVQVEMLRQFQIQQNELKAMLEKYSVNEALVTEIERLKEENNRLKSKY